MDQRHKDILLHNYVLLAEYMMPSIEQICKSLLSTNVITKRMLKDIMKNKDTDVKRAMDLLDLLPSRGPNTFDMFFNSLEENKLFEAAYILKPNQRTKHQNVSKSCATKSSDGEVKHPTFMGMNKSKGRHRPGGNTSIFNTKPNLTNKTLLHKSEKPWKPTRILMHDRRILKKHKTLEADVLFIMNRITPTNFDRLAIEMRSLNIQTYEDLSDLVMIFFDKVTMETTFVEVYAQLCKVMSSIKVPPPPGMKDNQSTFRVVILTKCQQEFEADKSIIFEDPEEKRKKIESEMPEGNERNEKIKSTLYQIKLKKLKFNGNIRFIGELFKLGMLTENIMHDCIYRLLKARDDYSLVAVSQLLATVGQILDTEKAKARMDQYFSFMAKIAEEQKSVEVIFKDAIELRNNNWVPLKEQIRPKKIDEVHKDYKQKHYTKHLLQSHPAPSRADPVLPNSRLGSMQHQNELKQSQDDVWGSKSLRIDASKMKFYKGSRQDRPALFIRVKIRPLSKKEMEHKAKVILEEYLNVLDFKEVKLCLKELKGQAYLDVLVSACINDVLEKTRQKRELTGQFFHEMVKNKLIPLESYLKGLSEVLMIADDIIIDIPKIWSYFAQLIAPMLIGGSVHWSKLVPILKDLNNKCCGKLLGEILLIAKTMKGENETALLRQASWLSWSMFMEDSDFNKFLIENKSDFTSFPVKASLHSKTSLVEFTAHPVKQSSITSQKIFEKITDDFGKIVKENGSNADILAYIENNVSKEILHNEFIRALITAVASSSVTSTKKPHEEAIKNCIKSHKDVLQQFIKSNVELELQALYAIQALMHKLEHPSNVIVNLFDALYDAEIISDEAFKKWEESTDPQELEGK